MSDEPNNLTEEPVAGNGTDPTAPVDETPLQEDVAQEAPAESPAEPAPEVQEEAMVEEPAEAPADDEEAGAEEETTSEETAAEGEAAIVLDWYILKVQSNREKSISEALQRRVSVEGLDEYFGDIIVPTEKVTEFKGGKKRVVRRKLYPGYILVHMHINDDTWFAVRETPGIGDFTGSGGKPTPMLPHEVQRIVSKQEEKTDEAPKLKINFKVGDRIKINEGTFESFEGEVSTLDEVSGRVIVMINIFGRSTPVELEYWQIETV